MCLAIPMRVMEVDSGGARCEARGVERRVGLMLLQHEDIRVGDYLLIHLGHAIDKVSESRALEAWSLYDEILAAEDAARAGGSGALPV